MSAEATAKFRPVYDLTPFSLLDFPGRVACIVWLAGCNLRCPYCHNPDTIGGKGRFTVDQVLNFLERRRGRLEGIVLSGGEATLFPGLRDFARTVRAMGYQIKLDTNGTRPQKVAELLSENLLDYVALDYKAPPRAFARTTGRLEKSGSETSNPLFPAFSQTLDQLIAGTIPFEVRTTVHTALLDETDVNAIIEDLDRRGFTGTFYVQNFTTPAATSETLEPLPPQVRPLDVTALVAPRGFRLETRNFLSLPAEKIQTCQA